jgi:hypothetical protein
MTTTTCKSNTAALATFMARKAEIDDLLVRIQAASDEHFGADPEALNWGQAGVVGEAAERLKEIAEFLGV